VTRRDDPTVDDSFFGEEAGTTATVPGAVATEAAASPFDVGATVGRYHLRERLGEGGMGVVFAAYDPGLDRTVAVKVLRHGYGGDRDEPHLRLQREGRVMARLSHPNVIQVFDVGYAQGSVFVAMEYVKGPTLKRWLELAHTPAEILAVFAQAGRGLAGAHDAGFVHRDFKPSNVLVSDDGRVLVTDFGLARPVDATEPATAATSLVGAALYVTLTREDAIVGTPAYMAPEQYRGDHLDARADQFSFCVALWHALYGALPFAGASWRELADAVTQGRRVEPPASAGVPPRVRAALERGLSPEPAQRFASMHDLLAALAPPRRRTGRWLALGGAGALVAVALAAWSLGRAPAGDPCATRHDRFAGIWDVQARAAIHRAFAASGVGYAEPVFAEVARQLDARRVEWEAMRRDSCEATRVRKEQSDAALDLRAACLERRFTDLAAFVGVLRQADADTVKGAALRATSVGDVAECADVAALERRTPVPPEHRDAVDTLGRDLASARAQVEAGHVQDAAATVAALVDRARALDYPPVLAEALQLAAFLEEKTDHADRAESDLDQAVGAADAGGDDARRFEIELALTRVVGYLRERDADGMAHADRARAVLRRLGPSTRREAQLAKVLTTHHWTYGRYPEALREGALAIARFEQLDPAGIDLASALHNVAIVYDDMNDAAHGLPLEDRALAIVRRALGPEHPRYGNSLNTRANLLRRLERLDEAEATQREHLALVERTLGPESSDAAAAHLNLGGILRDRDRLDDAIAELRRAVALYEHTAGPDHSWTANALDNLGGVLSRSERPALRAEAEPVLRRAVAIYTARLGPTAPPVATATRHLCEHLARVGRHADTIPLYQGAIRGVEASQGKDSPLLARPLLGLGQAHAALGHTAAARAALDRGLRVVDDDADDLKIRDRIVEALQQLPR